MFGSSTRRRALACGAFLLITVSACGGGNESSDITVATSDTVLVNTASGSVAVAADDVAGTTTSVAPGTGSTNPISKTVNTSPNSPSASGQQDGSADTGSGSNDSGGADTTVPSFDDAPTIVHKFTLNAMTIQMKNQDNSICVQPCRGYYLGWSANFNDNNRRIIYSSSSNGYKDIIANMVAGDAGDLLVMYQANQNAYPQIAGRYPFSFSGPVNASYNSGVNERLSYTYSGNSIEILLKSSASGSVCPQPCNGYYLGWSADFDDSNRTITYSSASNGYKDIIGSLRVGDSGQLLLMSSSGVKGRVPFIYLG